MKLNTFIKICCYIIATIFVIEFGCEFLTASDTLVNILGCLTFFSWGWLSYSWIKKLIS